MKINPKKWLLFAGMATSLTGVSSALGAFEATQGPWLFLFDVLAWPVDGQPSGFSPTARAINAVLGGVMVGWGAMISALARSGIPMSDLRPALLIGVVSWFVVDSSISLFVLPGNVLMNIIFLMVFLVALWPRPSR